jgi:DNA repair exonuclease SbcCD nuclease subunit
MVPYDDAPIDEIRRGTRSAMEALVSEAKERKVDLVVFSGDLFDGNWQDFDTGLFFTRQLVELNESGIPVAYVRGNHDAETKITKSLRLPDDTIRLDSKKPQTHIFDDIGVAVHGQSYAKPAETEDLAAAYPTGDPALINIGLLHTCFDGTLGHAPYAPTKTDVLASKGYDYWALGHVHTYKVVSTDPLAIFPGNLQGRNIRETGPKGAVVVTFGDDEPSIEPIVFDFVRWEDCIVDVSARSSYDGCLDACREALASVTPDTGPAYAIRVSFTGTTALHGELLKKSVGLTNDVRGLSYMISGRDIWIEKVKIATSPKIRRIAPASAGIAGEVGKVLADLAADPSVLTTNFGSPTPVLASLKEKLAAAGGTDVDDLLSPDALRGALTDAGEMLLALIGAGGGEPPGEDDDED